MDDEMVEIEIDLDDRTIELLEAEAKRTGATVNDIINQALKDMIDKYEGEEK